MNHDIPTWQIPEDNVVLTDDDEERELNEKLDTPRMVYTEEPDDEICPYCGNPYEGVTWASRVRDGSTNVPKYDTSEGDFIVTFVHQFYRSKHEKVATGVGTFCSPEYDDVLNRQGEAKDHDLSQLKKNERQ